jgi:hypothetical protein
VDIRSFSPATGGVFDSWQRHCPLRVWKVHPRTMPLITKKFVSGVEKLKLMKVPQSMRPRKLTYNTYKSKFVLFSKTMLSGKGSDMTDSTSLSTSKVAFGSVSKVAFCSVSKAAFGPVLLVALGSVSNVDVDCG